MSTPPHQPPRPNRLVEPFPAPGRLVELAYRDLELAIAAARPGLGAPITLDLPRPWDPANCQDPDLRRQLWDWLDAVAAWINTQHAWDPGPLIPACWPHHPHLIHNLAVLADQRRTAGHAATSDQLEDWHRYTLPGFTDRMRRTLAHHCDDDHQPSPATPRHTDHTRHTHDRAAQFDRDTGLP